MKLVQMHYNNINIIYCAICVDVYKCKLYISLYFDRFDQFILLFEK